MRKRKKQNRNNIKKTKTNEKSTNNGGPSEASLWAEECGNYRLGCSLCDNEPRATKATRVEAKRKRENKIKKRRTREKRKQQQVATTIEGNGGAQPLVSAAPPIGYGAEYQRHRNHCGAE